MKKKFLALIAMTAMLILGSFTVLAAEPQIPQPSENYSEEDIDNLFNCFYVYQEENEAWFIDMEEEGASLDPRHYPTGRLFIDYTYIKPLDEKQEEWNRLRESEDFDSDEFNTDDNRENRKVIYTELQTIVQNIFDNMQEGVRPENVDSLREKLENASDKVSVYTETYGDISEEESAQNLYLLVLDEGEILDEELIADASSQVPENAFWMLADDWEAYWHRENGMDWVCSQLYSYWCIIDEWWNHTDELEGLEGKIDDMMQKAAADFEFLNSKIYKGTKPVTVTTPTPEPETQETEETKSSTPYHKAKKSEEPEIKPEPMQVITSEGKVITSTLDGINASARLKVAVMTGLEQAKTAAGIGTGSKLSLYITDAKPSETAVTVMNDVSALLNRKTAGVFHADLYEISARGVTSLKTTPDKLRIIIRIPENDTAAGRTFSILVPDNQGNVLELPDLDSDDKTITVDASNFGVWTLVYQN